MILPSFPYSGMIYKAQLFLVYNCLVFSWRIIFFLENITSIACFPSVFIAEVRIRKSWKMPRETFLVKNLWQVNI